MYKSIWQSISLPSFPPLSLNQYGTSYDDIVVGGGITGLSTAYFLSKAGRKVCLLEKEQLCSGNTAFTTAHLTAVMDLRLSKLVQRFGDAKASLAWDAGTYAIEMIEEIVHDLKILCSFRRVPGFLCTSIDKKPADKAELSNLEQDLETARRLGIDARFEKNVPPFDRAAIRFIRQAKFHPLKYLAALAEEVARLGGEIFEHSEAQKIDTKSMKVVCNGMDLYYQNLILATHAPISVDSAFASALFQTKLIPSSTYVVASKVPKGQYPAVSYWDTSDPYYYLRIDRSKDFDLAILGGKDHKTGQSVDTTLPYLELRGKMKELFPNSKFQSQWSGQVIETHDGLPFIGEFAKGLYLATGFSGNGMTLGTFSGWLIGEMINSKMPRWQELFSPSRKQLRPTEVWSYVKENIDYPVCIAKNLFSNEGRKSFSDVKRGEGAVVDVDGEKRAFFREENGAEHNVSAICTHMGCVVQFNKAERTWDCPCHGSRFSLEGQVIAGPAKQPLASADQHEEKSSSAA